MVKKYLVAWLFLFWPSLLFCQWLEYSAVTKLPPSVNSPAEEGMPLLSPDGKRLFFSRALSSDNTGGEYGGLDIWLTEYDGKAWKKANNSLGTLNNKNNNVAVGLAREGRKLYLINASPFERMNGIYEARQVGTTWSRPQLITIPGIDNQDFIGFYVSPDLDVIFLSMKGQDSRGNEDLYYSVKDGMGSWSKPKNLGATINTSGFEISPFLSADKKRIYFSSNGHGGEGDADIFFSERLYDSWETWSVPVNLGPRVNSKKFDAYFSLYGDSLAYFSSNRDGRYADIFSVRVSESKSILAQGQRYLNADEWGAKVGRNVKRSIVFQSRATTVDASQQELLFYIVNKLMLEKDIRFHLVVKEEEDPALSRQRLKLLSDKLRQYGIDPVRINDYQLAEAKKSDRGEIEIRLFQ
jgi:hypothetical protein